MCKKSVWRITAFTTLAALKKKKVYAIMPHSRELLSGAKNFSFVYLYDYNVATNSVRQLVLIALHSML